MTICYHKPEWCCHKHCKVLCHLITAGGEQCIGKLDEPESHIHNGVNDVYRCHYDRIAGEIVTFSLNGNDLITDVFLAGEAMRQMGYHFPKEIINNLPFKED